MALVLADIEAAHQRISGHAVVTPLLQSPALNSTVGGAVFVKPENLQRSGSFKFRGAYNRLAKLDAEQRINGVVAWSSGNHAQGIAASAQLLDMPATIVMPSDAPHVKIAKTKAHGANIVFYDRNTQSREDIGRGLAEQNKAVLVPSYDDWDIMAGQGTCGLEIVQQADALGGSLDHLLVCTGGGGLIAGISTAVRHLSPETRVYSVEPAAFNDHQRSFETGKRERVAEGSRSICDALLAPEPGEMTFAVNKQTVERGLSVSDEEVLAAMAFAFREMKLVVEPGGAVALAALLAGKIDTKRKRTGIVISGGNVDPDLLANALDQNYRT